MAPNPDPAERRRTIASIHATAATLGMDTADKSPASVYRTMLRTQGGASSAADMDLAALKRVQAFLLRQANPGSSGVPKAARQAALIEKLWGQLGDAGALRDPSAAGLAAFVKSRQGVDSHLWLDAFKANRVIEALKAMLARHRARQAPTE